GVGAEFLGQDAAASFIGEQRTGAVPRFGLVAHERLVGILAHFVACQHAPAGRYGVGIVAALGREFRHLKQCVEESLAQAVALGLQPVGIGVGDEVVVGVEGDCLFV